MRPPGHRIDGAAGRGEPLTFQFDGSIITAYAGETIAAALVASGVPATRLSRLAMPRGYFCGMGVCWECLVSVNGSPNQRACMQTVDDGMVVETSRSPEKP